MSIILATQEAEIRRIAIWSQPGQIVFKILFPKTQSERIGLVEWLKVKALNSDPSTTNKKPQNNKQTNKKQVK
jgi:hypothetical protein